MSAQYIDTVSSGEAREGLEEFLHNIETNTRQYIKLFAEATDVIMPAPDRNDIPNDVFDVLLDQVSMFVVRTRHATVRLCTAWSEPDGFVALQRKKGVELQQEALTEAGIPVKALLVSAMPC